MPALSLHHVDHGGTGPTLVILHGLFGSSRNWTTMARRLSAIARVYALDLRNHGRSPHAPTHTLQDMVDDVAAWIRRERISSPILLGHSMGGLAVMGTALAHPALPAGIVVVDIAPKRYERRDDREFRALRLDVSACATRQEVDRMMRPLISDAALRNYLAMNLERTGAGFRWMLNVEPLEKGDYLSALGGSIASRYAGPALFLKAENSPFIESGDGARIRELFPSASIQVVPGANHWIQVSQPDRFYEQVARWMSGCQLPA